LRRRRNNDEEKGGGEEEEKAKEKEKERYLGLLGPRHDFSKVIGIGVISSILIHSILRNLMASSE